jgi:hypothetical protein
VSISVLKVGSYLPGRDLALKVIMSPGTSKHGGVRLPTSIRYHVDEEIAKATVNTGRT